MMTILAIIIGLATFGFVGYNWYKEDQKEQKGC